MPGSGIRVEHGIGHVKNWRALSRHLGRREHLETMLPAVAGLVSSQEQVVAASVGRIAGMCQ